MTAPAKIIPFAFDDHLVRVYKPNGEPWFVGRDVCHVLGLGNESKALSRLDPDERQDGISISDPIGREQKVIVVSEPGVFRLIFSSRKPEAERFKRWLAHDVLPALRKHGHYGQPAAPNADPVIEFPAEDGPLSVHMAKIATLRECRMIHGTRAAARLWRRLDMPAVAESVEDMAEGGRACLAHLLDHPLSNAAEARTLRWLIEGALNDDPEAEAALRDWQLRTATEGDRIGLVVPNLSMPLDAIFRDTPWAGGLWRSDLRSLPGVGVSARYVLGGVQRRATFIPEAVLDAIRPSPPAAPKPSGKVVPFNG
jgi:hypothetical protein